MAPETSNRELRSPRTIADPEESIRKFIKKSGPSEHLRARYGAGPTVLSIHGMVPLAQLGKAMCIQKWLHNGVTTIADDAVNNSRV